MDGGHDPAYSRAPEPDDLVRLCRALNDAGARYVLIGGFAVMAHGAGRYTKHTHRPQDAIDLSFLEGVVRDRDARRSLSPHAYPIALNGSIVVL